MKRSYFTLVELMVAVAIILLLVALVVGVVMKSQQEARYTRWLAYKQNVRTDPDVEAYYSFEAGEGDEVANEALGNPGDIDYRPKDRDGLINGASWHGIHGRWVGKNALHFDGVDDYVALGLDYTRASIQECTVIAWVKVEEKRDQIIISCDGSEVWELALTATGGVTWTTTDAGGNTHVMTSANAYSENNWVMVAGWFNANSFLVDKKIFVEGDVTSSGKFHAGDSLGDGDERPRTFGFLGVGSEAEARNGATGPNDYFRGIMDEVIVFHRALSDQEIRDHWKMGTP